MRITQLRFARPSVIILGWCVLRLSARDFSKTWMSRHLLCWLKAGAEARLFALSRNWRRPSTWSPGVPAVRLWQRLSYYRLVLMVGGKAFCRLLHVAYSATLLPDPELRGLEPWRASGLALLLGQTVFFYCQLRISSEPNCRNPFSGGFLIVVVGCEAWM